MTQALRTMFAEIAAVFASVRDVVADTNEVFAELGRWSQPWGPWVVGTGLLAATITSGAWKLLLVVAWLGLAALLLPVGALLALTLVGRILGLVLHVAKATERELREQR